MIIVAGYLRVDPAQRDSYLRGCIPVVRVARATAGCLDFCMSADLLDPARINIMERWDNREVVEAFRGSGPSDDQQAAIVAADVAEYDIATIRRLT